MAELVYALVLGTSVARLEGSSPSPGTLDIWVDICYTTLMSKLNKKSIHLEKLLAFKLLAIMAFSLLVIPFQVSADYGQNITFGEPSSRNPSEVASDYEAPVNPKPAIYSISPKEADMNPSGRTITITGKGFIPSSVARINGVNRPTNFIDSTHLLMQVEGRDMYAGDGGFYVTVFNPAPGGGFANS